MESGDPGKATRITITEDRLEAAHEPTPTQPSGRSRGVVARVVAYGLPLLVLAVAALEMHVWPVTEWRLFSGVRQGTQVTWIVEAVDSDGVARRYDPVSSGADRQNWRRSLDQSSGDQARQQALCQMWLDEAHSDDGSIEALTVQRARIEVPRRDGAAATVVWNDVVASCGR